MSTKALVTGASGFIGSTLIEELGRQGFEVHALLRKSSSTANLQGLKYQRVDGDLGDFEALKNAVRGMDYVFHLAGVTAAPNRAGYFKHNSEGTARVAQAVAEANPGVKRLVYVSSQAAAGPAKSLEPTKESDPAQPVSSYGQSKHQGEVELLKFKDRIPVSIVRPPMVYGPKDKDVFIIIQTISKNLMPLLSAATPDRSKYYSMVHAEDLCRGIILAGTAPLDKVPSGEVFFITGDGTHSQREFQGVIAESLGLRKPWTFGIPKFALVVAATLATGLTYFSKKTYALNLDKLNDILPDYWVCSNEKAKRVLGFAPKYDMRSGIAHTIDWYKKEKWI